MKKLTTTLLLITPLTALANAGSPVVWFSLFHLFIANAVIGIMESEILLKYKISHKVGRIILANYVSMIIGYLVIAPLFLHPKYGRDILSVHTNEIAIAFIVAFFTTLIIEYPLFLWSLRDKSQRKCLLKPFLVANIVTNAAMGAIYLWLKDMI